MNKFDATGDIVEDIPHDEVTEFYSLKKIKSLKCHYNIIFGKRSNGKTYSVLEEAVKKYVKYGEQTAYLRRYREDFIGKRGQNLFASIAANDVISQLTDGKWTTVKYNASQWFFAKPDEKNPDKLISASEPFCYGFSLSSMEHDKSVSYPKITTIIFDEFISRIGYLNNEFVTFMNCLSTIIRQRNNVTIYMLGNTVNKYCPYFKEMGLGHIEEMEPGKIDVYTYGESGLKVAVERTINHNIEGRKSEVYFAFDNPSLNMITGGAWELDLYPHCPRDFHDEDINYKFFLKFNDQILQGEFVCLDDCNFIYFHRKTGDIRHPERDLVFSDEYDPRPNHVRNIRRSSLKVCKRIGIFFRDEKVFYQDNDVGEVVRNYLQFCKTDII